mgnify:CR=1 FL=1
MEKPTKSPSTIRYGKLNRLRGEPLYTGYAYDKDTERFCLDILIINQKEKTQRLFKGIIDPNAQFDLLMTRQQAQSLKIDLTKVKLPERIKINGKGILAQKGFMHFLDYNIPVFQEIAPYGPLKLKSCVGYFLLASQEDLPLQENEILLGYIFQSGMNLFPSENKKAIKGIKHEDSLETRNPYPPALWDACPIEELEIVKSHKSILH